MCFYVCNCPMHFSQNVVNGGKRWSVNGHKDIFFFKDVVVCSLLFLKFYKVMSDCLHLAFLYVAPLSNNSWFLKKIFCFYFLLVGWSFASKWSACCSKWGVTSGQVKSWGYGNTEALHVHGREHSWEDPASSSPKTRGADRGEAVNAFIR